MADVKGKCCPFRVFREKTHFKHSQGEATTEKFYDCLGEKCAAYYQGGCLRLVPPEIVIGDGVVSASDVKKLWEEMRNAPLMVVPGSEPSVEVVQEKATVRDCSNCAVIFGEPCVECVRSDEPGTTPSNWKPMEEQK